MARFGEVQFKLRWLDRNTHGLWEKDGTVSVNPIPDMVDTILHELLHDFDPNLTERQVRAKTKRLMDQLTDDEMLTIYKEFQDRATESL